MSEIGKHLLIGPYRLTLPEGSKTSVEFSEMNKDVPNRELMTFWKIILGKFWFSIHLNTQPLLELKNWIDFTTKSDAAVKTINVGDIAGVTYGSYDKPRTWVDWWFRKGDLTLCIKLQSTIFPWAEASDQDKVMHRTLVESIVYTGKTQK